VVEGVQMCSPSIYGKQDLQTEEHSGTGRRTWLEKEWKAMQEDKERCPFD